MAVTNEELGSVERIRKGDPSAFEDFVCTHQQMIHALAYRMTGSMEDAEDLAQETFIRAYEQFSTFRGEAKIPPGCIRLPSTCA